MKKATPVKKPTKKQTTFSVSKSKDCSELAPQAVIIVEAIKELGPIERKALIAKLTPRLKNYKQPASRLLSYYAASLQKGQFIAIKTEEVEAPVKVKAKAKAKASATPETPVAPEPAPAAPAEAAPATSAVPVVPAS
jgi:hypothetical protein